MIDTINKFSETVETIGIFFSIISKSLGFLGIECLILLFISFLLLFFTNQINAIFPKLNYFFAISISLILAGITGMSLEGVSKFILVMLFPFIFSIVANLASKILKKN